MKRARSGSIPWAILRIKIFEGSRVLEGRDGGLFEGRFEDVVVIGIQAQDQGRLARTRGYLRVTQPQAPFELQSLRL